VPPVQSPDAPPTVGVYVLAVTLNATKFPSTVTFPGEPIDEVTNTEPVIESPFGFVVLYMMSAEAVAAFVEPSL
jgi:hypothetical protein